MSRRWTGCAAIALLMPLFALACSDNNKEPTTRPSNMRERQDAALRDPFGYSPEMGNSDISGGGLSEFDKEGFKRDLDHVLNP